MKIFFSLLNILLISLILIVVVGIEACSQKDTTVNFGGISAKFVENAPPLNVITNQNFPIYVDVKNIGDANINKGSAKFYLQGIGQNIQNVKTSLSNINLLDKGASERFDFASSAKSTLDLENPFTLTMFLTSCYKYGGRSQAEICIANSNNSKICSISASKSFSNSESPILAESLKESIIGNKLQISFNLVNKGSGEVYLPDADCDKLFLSPSKDINEVLKNGKLKVRVTALGEEFKCDFQALQPPYNNIQDVEGAASLGGVICEKSLAGAEDHQAVLQVVFDYIYIETISQGIVITPS